MSDFFSQKSLHPNVCFVVNASFSHSLRTCQYLLYCFSSLRIRVRMQSFIQIRICIIKNKDLQPLTKDSMLLAQWIFFKICGLSFENSRQGLLCQTVKIVGEKAQEPMASNKWFCSAQHGSFYIPIDKLCPDWQCKSSLQYN